MTMPSSRNILFETTSGAAQGNLNHALLDTPLIESLSRHFNAIGTLQQNILHYQWRGLEHGWNTLLAKQAHELDIWLETIREQFALKGVYIPLPQTAPVPAMMSGIEAEEETLVPADGMALAARMMTDFEALAWDLEGILVMAEQHQSTVVTDAIFGLNVFYRRSAGLYRQHLCSALCWLNQ
ncbi:MAG TPA: hypothetical protein VHP58_01395 [Alphaproteobacteria bacterium]|nr:hypothetical protein [Alphaproteobacteria bacterium]